MKRQLLYGIIFLLAGGLLLTTCNREYFELDRLSNEIEVQPQLVAPLIYGTMNLKDLVEEFDSTDVIDEFNDGLLYLAYSDTLVEVMADTMFEVQDNLVTKYYIDSDVEIPIWIGSQVGDTVPFYKDELITFTLDGNDRVDSLVIKGGEVVIDVASSFEHTGFLTISSSQILDVNRDTFSTVFEISDLSGDFTAQQTFPTDGYKLISTEINDSSFVRIHYKLDLINSGNPVNPDDQCEILISFENMDFYSVFGYIDSRNLINESGNVDIPLYADNPDLASLKFADPRINIYTASSVGIPFEVELTNVIASADDGSSETLEFYGGHPFLINAPDMGNIGSTVDTEININKDSSNIDALLNIAPTTLSYEVMGRTQPGTEGDSHFMLDTSKFMLELEFLLPLDFKSTGFALKDTFDFELGDEGVDTSLVKFAQVSVTTLNELPIELELQVYLLDVNHTMIDSVFVGDAVILGASQVDDQGILTQATEETNSVTFTTEKLGKLQDVYFMQVEARMITSESGDQFVKLFSQYSLDFEISMLANFRINTREL